MFEPNWITAICAVLGLLGGLLVWFNNAIQSRMPMVDFHIKQSAYCEHIFIVTLSPVRIRYAYQVENIHSTLELYSSYSGIDLLGKGRMKLENPLSPPERKLVVPSKYQHLDTEKSIQFYIDLKNHPSAFHRIRLDFSSQYFPWKWGKCVDLPVR